MAILHRFFSVNSLSHRLCLPNRYFFEGPTPVLRKAFRIRNVISAQEYVSLAGINARSPVDGKVLCHFKCEVHCQRMHIGAGAVESRRNGTDYRLLSGDAQSEGVVDVNPLTVNKKADSFTS